MNDDIAIKVDNVSKTFRLPHEKQNSIKGSLIGLVRGGKRTFEKQQVLSDVSFDVRHGEFLGIVGRNGSGKSTLLKMLAGIYSPSKGDIHINGKLTPFIELGVGFNPELTGRENVFLNGALLGFIRKEMEAMYDDIVAFAELKKFMDQKLKNYSSGMQVRLAFSIAIRADSPILLLDEVLAVGDALFQKKCYEYFKKLKKDKKTVVLVSHDTGVLQEYCDTGVLIEKGRIVKQGEIDGVVAEYVKILNSTQEVEYAKRKDRANLTHIGSGRATIDSAVIKVGNKGAIFTDEDNNVSIVITQTFNDDIDDPIYGLTVNDAAGARILAVNNLWSNIKTTPRKRGDKISVEWVLPNIFNSGRFILTPAVAAAGGSEILDQVSDMDEFTVSKRQFSNAATNLKYEMRVVAQ